MCVVRPFFPHLPFPTGHASVSTLYPRSLADLSCPVICWALKIFPRRCARSLLETVSLVSPSQRSRSVHTVCSSDGATSNSKVLSGVNSLEMRRSYKECASATWQLTVGLSLSVLPYCHAKRDRSVAALLLLAGRSGCRSYFSSLELLQGENTRRHNCVHRNTTPCRPDPGPDPAHRRHQSLLPVRYN